MRKFKTVLGMLVLAAAICGAMAACGKPKATFTITVLPFEHGFVSVSPQKPVQGGDAAVTATPAEGYAIGEFLIDGQSVDYIDRNDGSFGYTIRNIQADKTVEVVFVPGVQIAQDGIKLQAPFNQGSVIIFESDTTDTQLKNKLASRITVVKTYEDGTSGDAVPRAEYQMSISGTAVTVKETATGFTLSFTVAVTVAAPVGLEIDPPFDQGEVELFLNDNNDATLKIKLGFIGVYVLLEDGGRHQIGPEDYTLSIEGGEAIGYYVTVTLAADETIVTGFSAAVTQKTMNGVQIKNKGTFNQGGVVIYASDTTDAKLKAKLAALIQVYAQFTNSTEKLLTAGEYGLSLSGGTLTVSSGGFTDTLALTVTPVALESISAFYSGGVTVYGGHPLNEYETDIKNALTVTGLNNDGSPYNGGASVASYTLSIGGGDFPTAQGNTAVTVNYGGKTTQFNIYVTEVVQTGIELASPFNQGAAVLYSGENTDTLLKDKLSGLITVVPVYNDGTTGADPLAESEYTLSISGNTVFVMQPGKTWFETFLAAVTLDTPSDMIKTGNILSWTASFGASNGYDVKVYRVINGVELFNETVVSASYNIGIFRDLAFGEDYQVEVTARAVSGTYLKSATAAHAFNGERVYDFTNPVDQYNFENQAWCDNNTYLPIAYDSGRKAMRVGPVSSTGQQYIYSNVYLPVKTGWTVSFEVDAVKTGGGISGNITMEVGAILYGGGSDIRYGSPVTVSAGAWSVSPQIITVTAAADRDVLYLVFNVTNSSDRSNLSFYIRSVTVSGPADLDLTAFDIGEMAYCDNPNGMSAPIGFDTAQTAVKAANAAGAEIMYLEYNRPVKAGWEIEFEVDVKFPAAMDGLVSFAVGGKNYVTGGDVTFQVGFNYAATGTAWLGTQIITATASADRDYVYLVCNMAAVSARTGAELLVRKARITSKAGVQTPFNDQGYALPVFNNPLFKMTLAAWEAPMPLDRPFVQNDFDLVAAAGYDLIMHPWWNLCNFAGDQVQAMRFLDMAANAGLRVLIHDTDLVQAWHSPDYKTWYFGGPSDAPMNTKNVHLYQNHPAFAGINFVDEPATPQLYDAQVFTKLANRYAQVKALPAFQNKLVYVNLNPWWGAGVTSGTNYNSQYLDKFYNALDAKGYKPDVFSYDDYVLFRMDTNQAKYKNNQEVDKGSYLGPIWISNWQLETGKAKMDMQTDVSAVRDIYLQELAHIRTYAKTKNVPANVFLLTNGHYTGDSNPTSVRDTKAAGHWYKDVNENDIRWQTACAMAYGYQSISHFEYGAFGDLLTQTRTDHGGYSPVLDPVNGKPLILYQNMRNVNLEVRAWDQVYGSFVWQGTARVAGSSGGSNTLINKIDAVNVTALSGATVTSTEDLLVGQFKYGLFDGYMLTNARNPDLNRIAAVSVTFTGYNAVLIYENGVPRIQALDGSGQTSITIPAGNGAFVIPVKNK
ncbi:MAG: hypothetical protein FWE62_01335 [Firmicutes bacterium]|nr:hypothetical protein [Bacillota bacterium]